MIQAWLAERAMTLLAVGIIFLSVAAGVAYWKYTIARDAGDAATRACTTAFEERDLRDIEHAKLLTWERQGEIKTLTEFYETHNQEQLRELHDYAKNTDASLAAANANVARLQRFNRTAQREASCPEGGQAAANDSSGIGGTGRETLQDTEIAVSLKALKIVMEEYVKKYFQVVP